MPPGLPAAPPRPLLMAFSPGGDAAGMVRLWREHAARERLPLLASKLVKNGTDPRWVFKRLVTRALPELAASYPLRLDQLICTGISGRRG